MVEKRRETEEMQVWWLSRLLERAALLLLELDAEYGEQDPGLFLEVPEIVSEAEKALGEKLVLVRYISET